MLIAIGLFLFVLALAVFLAISVAQLMSILLRESATLSPLARVVGWIAAGLATGVIISLVLALTAELP